MGGRVGVVFVHGFLSGPQTWDDFARRIAEDEELRFAAELRFKYASPKVSLRPWRRVPDYDDIAEGLKVYLEVEGGEFSQLVLVSHSQGGLVVQRNLARMLSEGRSEDPKRTRNPSAAGSSPTRPTCAGL
ncbi:alpha/beta hydrolase [Streptomyces sp. D2-8]|uniref:alpha/beta fold hydrolase n=1 Tax=Streptomyces sp. D2-8 TaxID=2707767 RepID=UPI0020C136CF|nr:alpha/beta hydrolase [Streptomyces sp. D2-8]MCK8434957.1 alpha/beta hydrolase [Streptomyces sp. D2-8]